MGLYGRIILKAVWKKKKRWFCEKEDKISDYVIDLNYHEASEYQLVSIAAS
jgi:hypothetical protein